MSINVYFPIEFADIHEIIYSRNVQRTISKHFQRLTFPLEDLRSAGGPIYGVEAGTYDKKKLTSIVRCKSITLAGRRTADVYLETRKQFIWTE